MSTRQGRLYSQNRGEILPPVPENDVQENPTTQLDYQEELENQVEQGNEGQIQEPTSQLPPNIDGAPPTDSQRSAVATNKSTHDSAGDKDEFRKGLSEWIQSFLLEHPDFQMLWNPKEIFELLIEGGVALSNKQFSLDDSAPQTLLSKLPPISNPTSTTQWFFENYLENCSVIQEYLLSVSKGTVSTAHFTPCVESTLPISPGQSCLGYRAAFPRPEHLGKPFSLFDVNVYEPHMAYLQSINNKGKVAELKFTRNLVAFLFEAAVHAFNSVHVPHLSHQFVKFQALQALNILVQYERAGLHVTDIKLATHPEKAVRTFAQGMLDDQARPTLMSEKHKKIYDMAQTAKQKELKDNFKGQPSSSNFRSFGKGSYRQQNNKRYQPYQQQKQFRQFSNNSKQSFQFPQARQQGGNSNIYPQKEGN